MSEITSSAFNDSGCNLSSNTASASDVIRLIRELLRALGVNAESASLGALFHEKSANRLRRPGRRAISITRLCRRYLDHANGYYARKDGSTSTEAKNIEAALRLTRLTCGLTIDTKTEPGTSG